MEDKVTEIQNSVSDLIEHFCNTIDKINNESGLALLDNDPMSVSNLAVNGGAFTQPENKDEQTKNNYFETTCMNKNKTQSGSQINSETKNKFDQSIEDFSSNIILKTKEVKRLIDELPGIGATEEDQISLIHELTKEVEECEKERIKKIEKCETFLKYCESKITTISKEIINLKYI